MRGGGRGVVVPVLVAAAMLALAIGMASAPSVRAAGPAAYTVMNTSDGAVGSLRDAITQSNANDPGMGNHNTITFDSTVFPVGTPTTISLTSGTLALTRDVTITGPGSGSLTIARSTVMGTPQFGIFAVPPGVTATISDLTITGGNWGGDGGGISNQGSLALTGVVVTGNQAGNNGGGIENNGGTVTLTNVTVSGNTAVGNGGGINTFDATLIATNTTVSGNTAGAYGGGVEVFGSGPGQTGGMGTLTNVTISDNTAIANDGGGIDTGGTLTLTNLTVIGNTAGGVGGGLDNVGGTVSATRTIILGNTGGNFGGSGINGTNVSNLTMGVPLLAPLGDYGGSTQTRPPLPGSPAIDAGGTGCSATDQRGVSRPVGTACDIGAVESQGFTFSLPTGNNQTAAKNGPFGMPLGLTVTSSHNEPVVGGTVTFTGPTMGAGIAGSPLTASITGAAGASTGPVSQPVTANGTGGTYSVVASTSGVPTGGVGGDLSYTLTNATAVTSINRTTPLAQLTNAASVIYTVTFADPVSGLTAGDFAVTVPMGSGVTGTAITTVSPMGATPTATWTVTVTTGTGDGDLRLDFTGSANDTSPPVTGTFTTGEVYTIDKTAPTIASMPSPLLAATYGQMYSATFTASDAHTPTITGAMGLPMGFTFTPGMGAMANTATLSGTPTNTTTIMFSVQATDAAGNTTTSQPYTITVNTAPVTPSLTSSSPMNTSVFGQSVTLTATFTGTNNTPPTGTVTFKNGNTVLAAPVMLTAGNGATATATLMTNSLPVGMDSVSATYGGDGNYQASVGSLTQTVAKAAPTVVVTSSSVMNTSSVGQSVTFTATLTGVNGTAPTGTVSFVSSDGTVLAPQPLMPGMGATSSASVTTSALHAGADTITATYSGDTNYLAGTPAIVVQTVSKLTSGVSVTASPNTSAQGTSVTLTATVTGAMGGPVPGGSVSFTSGGTMLGMAILDGVGKASVTASTTPLPIGMDAITASYSGDGVYLPGSGMTTQTVTAPAVTMLTATAPTGMGSPNSGSATMPRLAPGASLTLTVQGSYTNGTMSSVSGVTFMSSNANIVAVDVSGKLTAIAPGTATITITAPNGVTTTITVVVETVPTGGLTNPNAQPMTHATVAPATVPPAVQPSRAPSGSGSGSSQPHSPGSPTPIPAVQPPRH